MKLRIARILTLAFACLVIVCAIGALVTKVGNPTLSLIFVIVCGVSLIGLILVLALCMKCPHCGRHLIQGGLRVTECPYCDKDLGLKKK